eukprot:scaffold305_cov247-Pinguiococcus_pyrenoidosus.AAC.33
MTTVHAAEKRDSRGATRTRTPSIRGGEPAREVAGTANGGACSLDESTGALQRYCDSMPARLQ